MSKKGIHQITKSDLISLLNKSDYEILKDISHTAFGFGMYLEKKMYATEENTNQILEIILEIISRVCSTSRSDCKARLNRFLRMLIECKEFLFDDVPRLINTCITANQNTNLVKLMFNYMNILKTLLHRDFSPHADILNKIFPILENYMNRLRERRLNSDNVDECFRELKEQVDRYENPSDSTDEDSDDDLNIRNFRTLSIVPRSDDLVNYEMYNIPQNIVDGPYKSVNHYLSVYYRLTREDMLRAFREHIKMYLSRSKNSNFDSVNFLYYEKVFIEYPPEYSAKGIFYKIIFTPSRPVDWSKKASLIPGSLVFLTSDDFRGSVVLATVAGNVKVRHSKSRDCQVSIKLEDDRYEMELLKDTKYVMIEPTAYFECYRHILSAIKAFTEENFPLEDIITYLNFDDPVPKYLHGKKYCLHEKCDDAAEPIDKCSCKVFDPLKDNEWPTSDDLKLDDQQYSAFKLALTRKVAVIQGPPGTGKTFIGAKVVRALLRNAAHTPIVICCLTNHALDQFLERMLSFTKKIVRLGSQSKSSVLEPHKLENLMAAIVQYHNNRKSGIECVDQALRKSLELVRKMSKSLLNQKIIDMVPPEFFALDTLSQKINHNLHLYVSCQEKYLEEDALNSIIDSKFKKQLRTVSGSIPKSLIAGVMEWLVCSRSSDFYAKCLKIFSQFKQKKQNNPPSDVKDIWSLTEKQRYNLFYHWREKCLNILKRECTELIEEYKTTMVKCDHKIIKNTQLELLKSADIVGVTSTGACKFKDQLQFARPQIFVIEEAAQVLESHIVAALTSSAQHLIMIGDHEQLRPLPCNDELSKKYKLSISMFERLFINNAPSATLITQHRMKPCIAELLVPIPYKEYQSFENVYKYEEIRGVESSVFFFDHRELEDENSSGTSSSNDFEARMVVALANYFVFCLYPQKEITILATYAAQYILIRKYLEEKKLDEIHVTTVDNFQGEENEIILVSFVRSNKAVIGFLKESNRVCVALSRAKKGMFCFGNFKLFADKNVMWRGIVEKLQDKNMIGDTLPLKCFRHDTVQRAMSSDEIYKFLSSGCSKQCSSELKCGHICPRKCHFNDPDHQHYLCKEPCNKMIDEVRICPRLCFERCKRVKKEPVQLPCGHYSSKIDDVCQVEVPKLLPCNHTVTIPCHVDEEQYKCKGLVSINLKCGHKKSVWCFLQHETKNVKCSENELQISPCGHTVEVPCGEFFEEDEVLSFCKKACETVLGCGHPCLQLCRICFDYGIHGFCTEKCELNLSCGHKCEGYCGSYCPPCSKKCFLSCVHRTFCINDCVRPCVQCLEPCAQECTHSKQCSKLCHEECNIHPCPEPCTKIQPCGHKCIGLCGDPCPSLCRDCDPESFKNDKEMSQYVELECNHIVDVSLLEEHIEDCLIAFEWPNCCVCSQPIKHSVRFKKKLREAKKRAIQNCETSEENKKVRYLAECMFGVDFIVPAQFLNFHKEILFALKRGNLQIDSLAVLKSCVMILKKLVNIAPCLLDENFDEHLQKKFETLMIWISRHLKRASIQQLTELDRAVTDLCNDVSRKSSSKLQKI